MNKEDCYFYLTNGCTKGQLCPFRHSPGAKTSQEVCPEYSGKRLCLKGDCGMRHSLFHAVGAGTGTSESVSPDMSGLSKTAKDKADEECYYEKVRGGCTRKNCPYKHSSADTKAEQVDAIGNLTSKLIELQSRFAALDNTIQELELSEI